MFALNVLNNYGHRCGFYGLKLDTEMLAVTRDLKIHIARPLANVVGGDQPRLIRSACSRMTVRTRASPGVAGMAASTWSRVSVTTP